VHTSMSSPVNWTIVALSLLMLAILQSVYCLHPDRVQFSLSNLTMAATKRVANAVTAAVSESFWYATHVAHQAKKVDRCCGCGCSKWGKMGRQCSATSTVVRLTTTYTTRSTTFRRCCALRA
jgi:hypothetical protein